jgi:hypothetical protein
MDKYNQCKSMKLDEAKVNLRPDTFFANSVRTKCSIPKAFSDSAYDMGALKN